MTCMRPDMSVGIRSGADKWMQWHLETSFARRRPAVPGDLLRDDVDPLVERHMHIPKEHTPVSKMSGIKRVATGSFVSPKLPPPAPKRTQASKRTPTLGRDDSNEIIDNLLPMMGEGCSLDPSCDERKPAARRASRGDPSVRFDSRGDLVATPSLVQQQQEMMRKFEMPSVATSAPLLPSSASLAGLEATSSLIRQQEEILARLQLGKREETPPRLTKPPPLEPSMRPGGRKVKVVVTTDYVQQAMLQDAAIRVRCVGCHKKLMATLDMHVIVCPGCSTMVPLELAEKV